MRNLRPRIYPASARSIRYDIAGVALAALLVFLGCAGDATKSGPPTTGIPQANFNAQLDPGASSFTWTLVPPPPSGRVQAQIELIGRNLVTDPAAGTVSLDVSIRNAGPGALPIPAQVWLDNFMPRGVEVVNADFVEPVTRSPERAKPSEARRFGFDYSTLVGADSVLSPAESSESKTWRFLVPGLSGFSFAAVATFGGGSEGPVVGGLVFNDLNGNGALDSGEGSLGGQLVLQRPDGTVSGAGTADGGRYSFPVQDVGLHTLTLRPPVPNCVCEVVVTTPNPLQVVLMPDGNGRPISYLDADFGVRIIQLDGPSPVVLIDAPSDSIRQDPYRMEVIGMDGDILTLHVGFTGCTRAHDFPLFMTGGFMESNPVQAHLVLGHNDHGEECDAVFERTLRFDLTPIRAAYERTYGQPGLVILRLSDLQGNEHSLRYRWGTPTGQNLLPNGGFERDGQATLDGWEVNNVALTSLVQEGAPDGGNWSLRLEADWAPTTGFVRAPVIGIRPGHRVRLSAWVRAEGNTGGGMIYLMSGAWTSEPVQSVFPDWTPLVQTVAPRMVAGDTLWVVLSSLPTEIVPRSALFDRVVLEN